MPSPAELTTSIDEAPPMRGSEYLRPAVLEALWRSMQTASSVELAERRPFAAGFSEKPRQPRAFPRRARSNGLSPDPMRAGVVSALRQSFS
jgi:hypothetical protein